MRLSFIIVAVFLLLAVNVCAAEVETGIYLLNLGKFDIATGAFTADFYLSLKCDNCSPENFEFMNGRATSIDKIIDTPDEKFYRIQANLNSPVDLKKFPFDSQKMQITLEDKRNTLDLLKYIPSKAETGIDKSVSFVGWDMDSWTAESKIHKYPLYDEEYSQYVFTVNISRIKWNAFFKTFLPVIVSILIVMLSFIMDPDKITTRIGVNTSSLVASVMFHISISNQIPPLGYLTTADKFMLLTYCILLSAVILNVTILQLSEQKKTELVEKVHRATEYSVFFIVPLVYAIFFWIFI